MQLFLVHVIFYVFAGILILSSIMMTLTHKSVHGILWLILSFVATAGLWILIQAEFLGLMLIIVYVGAVMTLFLFVLMMLNLDESSVNHKRHSLTWIGFFSIFIIMAGFLLILFIHPDLNQSIANSSSSTNNLTEIALALFSKESLNIELAGALLLLAMVGAIYLTHRAPSYAKKQVIAKQQAVSKKDRLKIVSGL